MSLRRQLLFATLSLPCCAGLAQADDLQLYGRLNLGLVHYGGYGTGHAATTRMHNLSSRFGVKGSEELGQGLRAQFVIETGFSADSGDGVMASREATLGLEGSFGRLRLGYMLSPLDDLHGIAGPGWLTSITNDNQNGFWANGYSNLFTGGSVGSTACKQVAGPDGNSNSFAFDNRIGNALRYDSPQFGAGWRLATLYALGEGNCGAWASSSKLQYQSGALNLALAWQLHHNVRGAGLRDQIWMAAGGWQLTPEHYAGFWWQTLRYDNPGRDTLRQQAFGATWRYSVGAQLWEAAWYHAGAGGGAQTPVFSGIYIGPGSASDLLIAGWRYRLSKRSELWAQLAQLRNGRNAAYELGAGGKAGATGNLGAHPHALALGIKHDF